MGSLTVETDIRTELFIDGQYRSTADRLDVVDPADPSVIVGSAAAGTEG